MVPKGVPATTHTYVLKQNAAHTLEKKKEKKKVVKYFFRKLLPSN